MRDLIVDGGLVHGGSASGAQIEQLGMKLRDGRRGATIAGSGGLKKVPGDEMFFDGYSGHGVSVLESNPLL